MFTIDLYTSYTALLTVFTTIQRIFAQKYISESLFMNISGKKTRKFRCSPLIGPFSKKIISGVKLFRYSIRPIGISFTKIIRLDGQIDEHWTAADDISESGKVHRE